MHFGLSKKIIGKKQFTGESMADGEF